MVLVCKRDGVGVGVGVGFVGPPCPPGVGEGVAVGGIVGVALGRVLPVGVGVGVAVAPGVGVGEEEGVGLGVGEAPGAVIVIDPGRVFCKASVSPIPAMEVPESKAKELVPLSLAVKLIEAKLPVPCLAVNEARL